MQARETATRILRDAREEEKQRQEREQKKKEDYDRKLEEEFKRDKERRLLIAQKGDEAAEIEREQERNIVEKILQNETTTKTKILSKE